MPSSSLGSTSLLPIAEIAAQLGLSPSSVEPYGWFAGKFVAGLEQQLADRPIGKLVGVTAITPTPFGEGKTVVAIGLAMGIARRERRAIVMLREPSLAPVFGIKGGGAGGGKSCVLPSTEINLHFTGDLHAVAAANNLLAAMADNHAQRGLSPRLDPQRIAWRRALDVSDKGLAAIQTGLNHVPQAPLRMTGFDLTAASEVMSILSLATSLADLRERMGRIVVGWSENGDYVTAGQLGAAGAMTALLKNAIRPNLVQTSENTPAIVHAGPFANISHGNSSIIADRIALRLADYVVTESGFGSDLGAEKFFGIKCRVAGLRPAAMVLVCTVRGVKHHSGRFEIRSGRPLPPELLKEDLDALREGVSNLEGHLANLRQFGPPIVVAINRFPTDTEAELHLLSSLALQAGAQHVALTEAFARGGEGSLALADAVIKVCQPTQEFQFHYPLTATYQEKIVDIATKVYGADGVDFGEGVEQRMHEFAARGYGNLPVCIAKTQYSLSHDAKRMGRPTGFRLPIREIRLAAGAGFVLALTEGISLMPGLPRDPAAKRIDIDDQGGIWGM